MGCGCKGGKTIEKTTTEKMKDGVSILRLPKMIGGFFLTFIVAFLLTPVMVIFLTIALYQGWFGDGFNINDILNRFRTQNDEDDLDDEEINPDDYEIVGVDKV